MSSDLNLSFTGYNINDIGGNMDHVKLYLLV